MTETIEQAANRLFYTVGNEGIASVDSFMKGAELQAERMFLLHDMWENHVREHFHPEFSSISFKAFVENYNKQIQIYK
jgi:hypothetical protein